jgi:hypothetical protein
MARGNDDHLGADAHEDGVSRCRHLIEAGRLPALTLALDVTREQLSDMLRLRKAGRLKEFHFKLEVEANES